MDPETLATNQQLQKFETALFRSPPSQHVPGHRILVISSANPTTPPRPTMPAASPTPDYYRLLLLPPPPHPTPLTASVIKKAYHRALLLHHPDKSRVTTKAGTVTVDVLTLAYETLRDPRKRAEYEQSRGAGAVGDGSVVQVTDLEEMVEGEGRWTMGCRCGEEEGFEVCEDELEEAEAEGEVLVGCRGCSLWRRVQFGVVEE